MISLSDNIGDEPKFGLGVSFSPAWSSESDVEQTLMAARTASRCGASLFLAGDKPGGADEVRSNAVILGWLLNELIGVPRIGFLHLVRQSPVDVMLAQLRTMGELIVRQGSTPIFGVMRGREPAMADLPGSSVEEAVDAIRAERCSADAEVWVAAEYGPALERAGRIADVWLANGYYDPESLAGQLRRVEAAAGSRVRAAVRRDFVVDEVGGRAHQRVRDLLANGYRNGKFTTESLVAGGPGECIERLAEVARLGFADVVVRPALDGPEGSEQLQMLFEHWTPAGSGARVDR
jgi:hypothetical protein